MPRPRRERGAPYEGLLAAGNRKHPYCQWASLGCCGWVVGCGVAAVVSLHRRCALLSFYCRQRRRPYLSLGLQAAPLCLVRVADAALAHRCRRASQGGRKSVPASAKPADEPVHGDSRASTAAHRQQQQPIHCTIPSIQPRSKAFLLMLENVC